VKIPIGAIIVSVFAIVWVAAGTRELKRGWFALWVALSILISLGVIYIGVHLTPAHPFRFHPKPYYISVALEAVFIFIAVLILRLTNRKYFILPVISIVVGLHFVGMVFAFDSNLYWWIAGAMCLLPILTMSILPSRLWLPVTGLGCAVILWSAAICAFF
jgi:hypothetical protein